MTNEEISIHMLILEKIATPLQLRFHAHIHSIPHLKGLHLTHTVTSGEFFKSHSSLEHIITRALFKMKLSMEMDQPQYSQNLSIFSQNPYNLPRLEKSVVNLLQIVASHEEEEYGLVWFWSTESMAMSQATKDYHITRTDPLMPSYIIWPVSWRERSQTGWCEQVQKTRGKHRRAMWKNHVRHECFSKLPQRGWQRKESVKSSPCRAGQTTLQLLHNSSKKKTKLNTNPTQFCSSREASSATWTAKTRN